MKCENVSAVAEMVQLALDNCPYSSSEVAHLTGFKSAEIVEGIGRGDWRVPLDKVPALAAALGCDRQQLSALVIKTWYAPDILHTIQEAFAINLFSAAERSWINFLRETFGESIPHLTPSLRRRVRLLANLPA